MRTPLYQKVDQVNNQTRPQLGLQFRLGHLTTRMLSQWTRTYMVLHFLQNSLAVQSEPASKHSDLESDHHSDPYSEDHSEQPKRVCSKAKKHLDKKKHKVRAK